MAADEDWKIQERERIKELILEGLASGPAIEATPELFKRLRAELHKSDGASESSKNPSNLY